MSVTGYPDRLPVRIGISAIDCVTVANAAFLITAHCGNGTEGGQIRRCRCLLRGPLHRTVCGDRWLPTRAGTSMEGVVPNDINYAKDDRPLYVTAVNDHLFERLCTAVGREGLATASGSRPITPDSSTRRGFARNRGRRSPPTGEANSLAYSRTGVPVGRPRQ